MKILISDMFGTLIPNGINNIDYCYSPILCERKLHDKEKYYEDKNYYDYLLDRAFEHLKAQLVPFFEANNQLKIVTAVGDHDKANVIVKEYINRFFKTFSQYEDNFEIYLIRTQKVIRELNHYLDFQVNIVDEDKRAVIEFADGKKCYLIDNKTDVYNFVDKDKILNGSCLYSIGDTYKDLEMILNCSNLNGVGTIICNSLYNYQPDVNQIIHEATIWNLKFLCLDKIKELYADFDKMSGKEQMSIFTQLYNDYLELYDEEAKNIYNLLYQGELDLNTLIKNHILYRLADDYNMDICLSFKSQDKDKSMIDGRDLLSLEVYPTFQEYRQKELLKNNNRSM